VLEYLHVPHDLPLAPQHQSLFALAKMKDKDKDKDLEEGTPDHPGEPLETAEVNGDSSDAPKLQNVVRAPLRQAQGGLSPAIAGSGRNHQAPAANPAADDYVVQAALREPASQKAYSVAPAAPANAPGAASEVAARLPSTGTVVLEVEQGGIEVPSFVGKTVRGAVEAAQDAGLQLDAVGSGVARQQSPVAGTHVAAGARVTVQFGR